MFALPRLLVESFYIERPFGKLLGTCQHLYGNSARISANYPSENVNAAIDPLSCRALLHLAF